MSSSGINKVILIGNLGKDPEIRAMQNGKEMANFSIATSDSWLDKSSGTRTEKTEWHNIVIFNEGLVKIIKDYVRKGTKVYIEGSLRTRKWTDQNNNDRYITEVVLQGFNSAFSILDSRSGFVDNMNNNNPNSSSMRDESMKNNEFEELIDDEIPF